MLERPRVGAGRRVRRRQRRGRLRGDPPGDRDGPAGAGAAMSVLRLGGVVLIGGAGSVLRFCVDGIVASAPGGTSRTGRWPSTCPARSSSGCSPGSPLGEDRRCWPARRPSAPTRRSLPGCWRPQRLTEERQYRKASLNIVVSLVLGVAAAALGQADRRAAVNGRTALQAHQLLRRAAPNAGAASPPTRCSTCTGGTRSRPASCCAAPRASALKRHPRTDLSLTLSEDLPLIAVAVDTRSRIEPLVEPTARLDRDRARHPGAGAAADRGRRPRLAARGRCTRRPS